MDCDQYEYRADHMTLDELEKITAESSFYGTVVSKLLSRGAKLIVGPRGVGKTHHMRIAYKQGLSKPTKPFPIYITLSKYLRLEPLRNNSSIAIEYFHCWVLCKVMLGVKESLELLKCDIKTTHLNDDDIDWNGLVLFCEQIEKQQVREWHDTVLDRLSVNFVTSFIESALIQSNRKHAVILCDDAALVLTKDYMIEFFDIFRSLKSAKISPKASVYPNTEFGPRFHVGQDAESISCWPPIDDDEYVSLFEDIYKKRYDFEIKDDVIKCFMYAAFGVPRVFINLVNQFSRGTQKTLQSKVNAVLDEQSQIIKQEFKTLERKLPQYKNYVSIGEELLGKVIGELARANRDSIKNGKQQYMLGVLQDSQRGKHQKDIDIMIKLLEETGLIYRTTPVKHGENTGGGARTYDRFIPHFTLFINDKAYQVGKGGYINNFSKVISFPLEKHPLRKNSFVDFLKAEELDSLFLDLPSCSSCGEKRKDPEQKFCMFCGSELINKSTFESLVNMHIDALPLTAWLKTRIKEETRIETISDIVFSSNPAQELMKARGVGIVKASRVIDEASRLMEEFLS